MVSTKKLVHLSYWAREEVDWWLNLDIKDCQMYLRSLPIRETSRLATDTMDTAIGSVFEGRVIYEACPRWLKKEVVQMQILLHEQNTEVIPVHIRLAQQLHTDLISRKKVMPDWHLDRSIAQKLFQLLG